MSRHGKLLDRLRDPQRDASWDFIELCQLLQRLGFENARCRKSLFLPQGGREGSD